MVEGGQYAIVVNYVGAPPIGLGLGQGDWSGTRIGGYSGGMDFSSIDGVLWSSDGLGDLTFETYVQPKSVPEPTISLLIFIRSLAFLSGKSTGLRRKRSSLFSTSFGLA